MHTAVSSHPTPGYLSLFYNSYMRKFFSKLLKPAVCNINKKCQKARGGVSSTYMRVIDRGKTSSWLFLIELCISTDGCWTPGRRQHRFISSQNICLTIYCQDIVRVLAKCFFFAHTEVTYFSFDQ